MDTTKILQGVDARVADALLASALTSLLPLNYGEKIATR
jgi:hypothetical protein